MNQWYNDLHTFVKGPPMQGTQSPAFDAAILTRVVQPDRDNLTAAGARALLKLEFTAVDRQRMHQLAVKNQNGNLTRTEENELDSYVRVGRLIDLLAAKACRSLKKRGHDA